MTIKKSFEWENIMFRIVERQEPYLKGESVTAIRVVAPNNKVVPITIKHKETLKSIKERTLLLLEDVKRDKGLNYVLSELNS